jgi:site-specific recombinase XerD
MRRNSAREARELRGRAVSAQKMIAWIKDQCALIAQITPHWFRHHPATFILSHGANIRSVMEQGGWRSMDVVLGYAHDIPEQRRAHVNSMAAAVNTSFARECGAAPKIK